MTNIEISFDAAVAARLRDADRAALTAFAEALYQAGYRDGWKAVAEAPEMQAVLERALDDAYAKGHRAAKIGRPLATQMVDVELLREAIARPVNITLAQSTRKVLERDAKGQVVAIIEEP